MCVYLNGIGKMVLFNVVGEVELVKCIEVGLYVEYLLEIWKCFGEN